MHRRKGVSSSHLIKCSAKKELVLPFDINLLRVSRGGNPELGRQSQRNRIASVELVDEVIALDDVSSLYSVSWNRSGEASLV